MRSVVRFLFYLFSLLFLLSLERTIGLPFLSFVVMVMVLSFFDTEQKVFGLVLLGFLLAIVYALPFSLGVGILLFLYLGLKQQSNFFRRESIKVWILILICNGFLAVYLRIQPSFFQISYHFGMALLLLFVIQSWLYYQQPNQKIRFGVKS